MQEIRWQAPEFEKRERGPLWYWGSIAVAVLILGFAVWQKNFLFAMFVAIAELLVLTWGAREPHMIEFSANSRGVALGPKSFYAWGDIESFAIDLDSHEELEWQDCVLHFKRHLRPSVMLHVPKQKLNEIIETFAERVPQVEFELSFFDALARWLGL